MTATISFDVSRMPRELARTEAITQAQPERHTPLRAIAQKLSRRGVAAAKCELANSALLALVEVLHELDTDGSMPNVDGDGRILVPVPWGKLGYHHWGLRASEGRALNWLLRRRSEVENEPLFVFDGDTRQWLLGRKYESRKHAIAYLRLCPVTLPEWRAGWDSTRSAWARRNLGDR